MTCRIPRTSPVEAREAMQAQAGAHLQAKASMLRSSSARRRWPPMSSVSRNCHRTGKTGLKPGATISSGTITRRAGLVETIAASETKLDEGLRAFDGLRDLV